MFDWLSGIVGEDTSPIVTYVLIFILLIAAFFILRAALHRMRGGTFVHGGHGRKKRLAVIDAAPVDNRRRLVLVRRDDVEHLVLIGGMNDLVVERNIGIQASSNVDTPNPSLGSQPDKSKTEPRKEPVKPSPPPKPQPRSLVAEPKPQPAPRVEKQKAEPTLQRQAPVASQPTTNPVEASLALGAGTVAASAGITSKQAAQDLQTGAPKADEISPPETMASPAKPTFRDYAEMEQERIQASTTADDEKKEAAIDEQVDEFMPISAPKPPFVENEKPTSKVEPDAPQDDSDLEDEMERLLNKLTGPAKSQ